MANDQKNEKREFIKQYVLNRALARDVPLDPHGVAKAAAQAWDYIESVSKEPARQPAPYTAYVDGKFVP